MSRRVLQVLGRSAGGIARHVASVTEALDDTEGFSIDVAGPPDLPVPMPKTVLPLEIPGGPLGGHRAARARISALVETGGYEVVHSHGLRAGIDAGIAARRAGVPSVVTVHNLVQPEIAGPLKARAYRLAEPLVVRKNTRTLCVSEEIAARLRQAGGAEGRVEVLYLGIGGPPEVTRERAAVRAEIGAEERPLLVTVSRLSPQKALHVLFEAVASLDRDVVLAVLGEGPLEGELRTRAADLGVAERVLFLGFRPDVADFVAAADVFCLSSIWEGVPLAVQEAMLLGTPVVGTAVGGMPEIVSDGVSGRLVAKADAVGLAGAIDEVIASPETARSYSRAARERIEERFSTEGMLERLRSLYREPS